MFRFCGLIVFFTSSYCHPERSEGFRVHKVMTMWMHPRFFTSFNNSSSSLKVPLNDKGFGGGQNDAKKKRTSLKTDSLD